MAPGSTHPLTEMSTRNLPGGKGRPARKADNLTAICELIVYKMWEPRRLTTLWARTACYRDSFTLFFTTFMALLNITEEETSVYNSLPILAWKVKICSKEIQLSPSFGTLLNQFAKNALFYVDIYQVCCYNKY
jgi:hypothetical protein